MTLSSSLRISTAGVIVLCFYFNVFAQSTKTDVDQVTSDPSMRPVLGLRQLAIETLSVSIEEGNVRYSVENRSSREITAWEVEYELTYGSGNTSSLSHATDWAMTGRATFEEGEGPLRPGERREITASPVPDHSHRSADHGELVNMGVTALAIVYDDTSSAGNPACTSRILEGRKIQQFVRIHWLDKFRSLLAHSADEPDLLAGARTIERQLKEGLARYVSGRYSSDHPFARMEERNLAGFLGFSHSGSGLRSNVRPFREIADLVGRLEALVRASEPHVPKK